MKEQARKSSEILNNKKKILLIGVGLFMALVSLVVYYITLKVLKRPPAAAHSMTLLTLIMFEVSNAFNFRSLYSSFFKTSLRRNKVLLYASALSLLSTVAIIYVPFLQKVFETTALPLSAWLFTFVLSLSVIFVVDIAKKIDKNSFEDIK
jgi:magnesium-transporting ATPase (P-type)